MIPLRDNIRSSRYPVVSVALIALNVLVFLYELSLAPPARALFFQTFGVVPNQIGGPAAVLAAFTTGQWSSLLPLVTAAFVHGGWLHLIGNMWYMWVFADNIEDHLGHGRFLLFFLVAAVLGNYSQVLADPTSAIPLVGASGAVAGVLGAYLLQFPRAKVLALVPIGFFITVTEVPAVVFLFIWFLLQLLSGVASVGVNAMAGVAWWAHVGGFLAGILLLRLLSPRRRQYPY